MTPRLRAGVLTIGAAALSAALALAQAAPETFTATASAKKEGKSASAAFTVTVTRYATPAERDLVMKAVREGGTAALQKAVAKMPDAGVIQLNDRKTAVKYAGQRQTTAGRLITVVTAEPILHLGAGLPNPKPTTGFDVAVAMFEITAGGGMGDFAPAAKVALNKEGALVIEDYGATVIWLRDFKVTK